MTYFLLTSEFPPQYGGGISTYCMETTRMLVSHGHKVTIITQSFDISNISKEEQQITFNKSRSTNSESIYTGCNSQQNTSFTIFRFNPNKYFTTSFLGYETNLSYAFAQTVKKIIETEGMPDIIESQEYMGIAYYLLQFKHLQYSIFKDIKIILTLHAPSFLYSEYNKINNYRFPYFWIGEMEKFCIRAADMLISPSKYLVAEIQSRFDISNKTIHILKNPYQVTFNYNYTNFEKNKYVFLGKLTPQKGCLELIEFFKQLWVQKFDYTLIMIGGGDHLYHPEGIDMIDFIKQKYKNEIRKKQLQLIGSIHPKNIKKHIENAHAILIPSVVENLPYTVLESMAEGKIVLASKQGGQTEIIDDGIDGFIFDYNEQNSFFNKLKTLNSLSNEELINLSKNAHNKILNNYSYNVIYEQKIKLLNILLHADITYSEYPFIRPIINAEEIQSVKISKKAKDNIQNTSLLSVVIPYYNMGKYVEETLNSIVNSTHKNIEIILVNDGSTEAQSNDAINELEKKYKLKVINKKNEGLACARNDGAQNATGDFLAFLDPDDTVEPTYYEKAINILSMKDNVFFVGCWANYFGEGKGYWPTFNPEPPYLLVHNVINSSALVYKKEAFLKSGLNDREMIYGMEDYESVIHLVKNKYQGVALPEPLWNYRVRKNSMARAFTTEKQLYLYKIIADKHIDFIRNFSNEIIHIINANGSAISYDNPTLHDHLNGFSFLNSRTKQYIISMLKRKKVLRKLILFIKKTTFAKK